MDEVMVDRAYLAELEKESQFLGYLYRAGVDNWEGFEIALEAQEEANEISE
jgi:hypothetical protein